MKEVLKMKRIRKGLVIGILMLSILITQVQPVYASDAFEGWNDETKEDAWSVYAMTDWSVFSRELLFGTAKGGANAVGISSAVELYRGRIRAILEGMNETYGIYPNTNYTELILCLIQVLSNGAPDENDPAQVCKYINPSIHIQSINFEKSIKELFKRLSACEEAHSGGGDLFVNDEKLQSIIQGVVFSPTYTAGNPSYSVSNAERFKQANPSLLHGNPSAYFAQMVSQYYNCTSVASGVFAHPCPNAVVTSPFGYRTFDNSFHNGLDLAAPEGTPTYAAESGTVLYARWSDSAGNWVVIDHGGGLVTKYMHHSSYIVSEGQHVEKGQQIGFVGNTGNSFGAHLHFQVEQNGTPVDPEQYL